LNFENQPYELVNIDPYFSYYATQGRLLTNYFAITHPSQPNYWSQIAGDFFKINSDDNHDLDYTNVIDLLDKKGITWKSYQEAYPGNCTPDYSYKTYYRKHNPFMSFDNIRKNSTRCANIVNSDVLDSDIAKKSFPQYMYFTPDINNDAHDTDILFAGEWLSLFLDKRLKSLPPRTVVVITWDEDDYIKDNHIYSALLGDVVVPGSQDATFYNHYSILRTVEDNWDLGNLGRGDVKANPFQFK